MLVCIRIYHLLLVSSVISPRIKCIYRPNIATPVRPTPTRRPLALFWNLALLKTLFVLHLVSNHSNSTSGKRPTQTIYRYRKLFFVPVGTTTSSDMQPPESMTSENTGLSPTATTTTRQAASSAAEVTSHVPSATEPVVPPSNSVEDSEHMTSEQISEPTTGLFK